MERSVILKTLLEEVKLWRFSTWKTDCTGKYNLFIIFLKREQCWSPGSEMFGFEIYCNAWCITPWRYPKILDRQWGLYTRYGGMQENFCNAFLRTKRCPWAIRGQKQKIAKKIFFFICSQNWGLYTRRLYVRHYSIRPLLLNGGFLFQVQGSHIMKRPTSPCCILRVPMSSGVMIGCLAALDTSQSSARCGIFWTINTTTKSI